GRAPGSRRSAAGQVQTSDNLRRGKATANGFGKLVQGEGERRNLRLGSAKIGVELRRGIEKLPLVANEFGDKPAVIFEAELITLRSLAKRRRGGKTTAAQTAPPLPGEGEIATRARRPDMHGCVRAQIIARERRRDGSRRLDRLARQHRLPAPRHIDRSERREAATEAVRAEQDCPLADLVIRHRALGAAPPADQPRQQIGKTRLNSSHVKISY